MELSYFMGRMAALKNEFSSILPKSTKTSHSKTDQVFFILSLIKLEPDFESVWEQILTESAILSFDEIFARLLRHSSTTTKSRHFEGTLDTSTMISQSHPQGDFRGDRGGNRGRGQRPHCTYCNQVDHNRDRCYPLHGRPPRIAHMA